MYLQYKCICVPVKFYKLQDTPVYYDFRDLDSAINLFQLLMTSVNVLNVCLTFQTDMFETVS